jgi:hypothetical protein
MPSVSVALLASDWLSCEGPPALCGAMTPLRCHDPSAKDDTARAMSTATRPLSTPHGLTRSLLIALALGLCSRPSTTTTTSDLPLTAEGRRRGHFALARLVDLASPRRRRHHVERTSVRARAICRFQAHPRASPWAASSAPRRGAPRRARSGRLAGRRSSFASAFASDGSNVRRSDADTRSMNERVEEAEILCVALHGSDSGAERLRPAKYGPRAGDTGQAEPLAQMELRNIVSYSQAEALMCQDRALENRTRCVR